MTRLIERRCDHCKVYYTYQASGPVNPDYQGTSQHCLWCKAAIEKALEEIPVKFSERWMNIEEDSSRFGGIDKETLLRWEKEWGKDNKGKLVGQRIWPGLFKTDSNDYQSVRSIKGREGYAPYNFRLSTWRSDSEYKIEVQMEWDNISREWTGSLW